ncbi:MAG TPA: alpha/beta hydrolase [Gemmatimonadaceae bacterium]|nr:alpha/beta hydrolase [Gemmatimonadaceae bacterium]
MAYGTFLSPAEMFPAGRQDLRVRQLRLASGLAVRIVEAGNEHDPVVLLVPGWGCSTYIHRDTIAPVAAAGYHAVAVDLKGHGLSDKPTDSAEYTLESMSHHLVEIIDALECGPAHLVGHSMGGVIAALAAKGAQHKVRSLVLVSPVGFAGVPGMRFLRLATPVSLLPIIRRITTHAMIRLLLGFVYGKRRDATDRDAEEFRAPVQFPEFILAMRHLLHRIDWSTTFPKLSTPFMTILGTEDILSPDSDADIFRGPRGDNPVHILKGVGHVVFDEAPEIANPLMTAFFSGAR